MKLLQRSSLYQLALAVPIVIVGTAIGYWLVSAVVKEEVDEQLTFRSKRIAQDLRNGKEDFTTGASSEMMLVVPGVSAGTMFMDSVMPEPEDDGELMPWRIGRFPAEYADGTPCTITVGRSLLETEDLVMGIAASMTVLLLLVVLANLLLNRWLSRKLWKPFHDALATLERFRMDAPSAGALPASDVDEFNAMNRTLDTMMMKMRADFTTQKRFTEQAAHELQTPLAVMQGKLDQLIQSPNMGEQEAGTIDGLFQARERMGRTVTHMLLLARIGNRQFAPERIDWSALFRDQHAALEDLITERGINFTMHEEEACRVRLHPLLAELIVANLLRNAVQHNIPSGSIEVAIHASSFTIRNTGPELPVDPTTLFDRFAKGDPSSASTGLGLSIVKEIADGNGLLVSYGISHGTHTIAVRNG
ncbi:MAG: HAMP domain-containing histidine kinase [Flavobacteriales bacterium]|nr:HAMP domain-containing histidine kinase [Flavobacteriales bacterium]